MLGSVKRIGMILTVAVFMVVVLAVSAIPAFARETNFFFIPLEDAPENGVTVTCGDTDNPIDITTCEFERFGEPGDLICDIPVIFEIFGIPILEGFQCRTLEEEEAKPPAPAPLAPAPLAPAPVTQESEQESDSGEIGQSFEVS